MATATQESIEKILRGLSDVSGLRELFSELNYEPARDSLPRTDWLDAAREALADDPMIVALHDEFKVIYCRLAAS
jgi:hypothetical protein